MGINRQMDTCNWTSGDEEGLGEDLTVNLNLHLNPNLDLTVSWI
jgi:hypothetical protein